MITLQPHYLNTFPCHTVGNGPDPHEWKLIFPEGAHHFPTAVLERLSFFKKLFQSSMKECIAKEIAIENFSLSELQAVITLSLTDEFIWDILDKEQLILPDLYESLADAVIYFNAENHEPILKRLKEQILILSFEQAQTIAKGYEKGSEKTPLLVEKAEEILNQSLYFENDKKASEVFLEIQSIRRKLLTKFSYNLHLRVSYLEGHFKGDKIPLTSHYYKSVRSDDPASAKVLEDYKKAFLERSKKSQLHNRPDLYPYLFGPIFLFDSYKLDCEDHFDFGEYGPRELEKNLFCRSPLLDRHIVKEDLVTKPFTEEQKNFRDYLLSLQEPLSQKDENLLKPMIITNLGLNNFKLIFTDISKITKRNNCLIIDIRNLTLRYHIKSNHFRQEGYNFLSETLERLERDSLFIS